MRITVCSISVAVLAVAIVGSLTLSRAALSPARAATVAKSKGKPVNFSADSMEVEPTTQKVLLNGKAVVETDELKLEAGQIQLIPKNDGALDEVRATGGNVRVTMRTARIGTGPAGPTTATCASATYRGATRQITMEGPVLIKYGGGGILLGAELETERAVIDLASRDGMHIKLESASGLLWINEEEIGSGATGKGKGN